MYMFWNCCTAQKALHLAAAMCGYPCGCFHPYPIATPATAWLLFGLKPPLSCA